MDLELALDFFDIHTYTKPTTSVSLMQFCVKICLKNSLQFALKRYVNQNGVPHFTSCVLFWDPKLFIAHKGVDIDPVTNGEADLSKCHTWFSN